MLSDLMHLRKVIGRASTGVESQLLHKSKEKNYHKFVHIFNEGPQVSKKEAFSDDEVHPFCGPSEASLSSNNL